MEQACRLAPLSCCVMRSPLSPLQAVDSRDSMAMALYSQCFNWIICKLNNRIRGKEDFKSISILDIFGFENFEVGLNRRRSLYPHPILIITVLQ